MSLLEEKSTAEYYEGDRDAEEKEMEFLRGLVAVVCIALPAAAALWAALTFAAVQ